MQSQFWGLEVWTQFFWAEITVVARLCSLQNLLGRRPSPSLSASGDASIAFPVATCCLLVHVLGPPSISFIRVLETGF